MTTLSETRWKPVYWYLLVAVGVTMAMALPRLALPSEINCEQANTTVDVAVCGDDTLLAADKKVRGLVQELGQFDPQAEIDQEGWRESTRDRCTDPDCLSTVYLDRIGVVQAKIQVRQAAKTPRTIFQAPLDYGQIVMSNAGVSEESGRYQTSGDALNPRAAQDQSERNERSNVVLWTMFGIFGLTLLIGSSGTAVICAEISDVFWTMAPYTAAFAGYVVYSMQDPLPNGQSEAQMLIVVVTSFLVTLSVIKNFYAGGHLNMYQPWPSKMGQGQ